MEQSPIKALFALMRVKILSVTGSDFLDQLPTPHLPPVLMVNPPQKPSVGWPKFPYRWQFSQEYPKFPDPGPLLWSTTEVRECKAALDAEHLSVVPVAETQPRPITRTDIGGSPDTGPVKSLSALSGPPLPRLPSIASLLQSVAPNLSESAGPSKEKETRDSDPDVSNPSCPKVLVALRESKAGTCDCVTTVQALGDKLQKAEETSSTLTTQIGTLTTKLSAAEEERKSAQGRNIQLRQELERLKKKNLPASKAEITSLRTKLKARDRENDRLHGVILTNAALDEQRLQQARAEGEYTGRSKADTEHAAQLAIWKNWHMFPGEAISNYIVSDQGYIDTDGYLLLQRLSEKTDRNQAVQLLMRENKRRTNNVSVPGSGFLSIPAISNIDIQNVLEYLEGDYTKGATRTSRTTFNLDTSTVSKTDMHDTRAIASKPIGIPRFPVRSQNSEPRKQTVPRHPFPHQSKRICAEKSNISSGKRARLATPTVEPITTCSVPELTDEDTIIVDVGH